MSSIQRAARHSQHGFTLIELLIVVAIVGILAAVAIPRFVDATATAKQGALKGAAGAVASAAATNYALRAAGNTGASTLAITSCTPTWSTIVQIPDDMEVVAGTTAPTNGVLGDCNIRYTADTASTYNFKVIGSN